MCKIVSLNILDEQNLSDCLWAISYSIDGPKDRILPFVESKAIPNVIQNAKSHLLSIASPALRILGTTSTGNEVLTQVLLDNKILDTFEELLDSKKSLVRREVCWTLSNIAAGTRPQIEMLLGREQLIDKVLMLFELDSSEVKREICYIFANMTFLGDRGKVKQLILSK
jgi:importin subunit alpha-1